MTPGEMTRYYPPTNFHVLFGPVGMALMFSLPAVRTRHGPLLFAMLFAAIFCAIFALWRHYLRVEVTDSVIRGRHPETSKWTEIRLAEIRRATPWEYAIGSIPGWSFESAGGKAVFVHKGGPVDARIRHIIDTRAT
jgi:hypothetical protein